MEVDTEIIREPAVAVEEVIVAASAGPYAQDAFVISFQNVSNFNQMLDIISNLADIQQHGLVFEIVRRDAAGFEGIMVSHVTTSSVVFFGRLECEVLHLASPQYAIFCVNIATLVNFLSGIETSHMLVLKKELGDNKMLYARVQPVQNSSAAMKHEYSFPEILYPDDVMYLQDMRFNFSVSMLTDTLKNSLSKATKADVKDVELRMEEFKNKDAMAYVFTIFGAAEGGGGTVKDTKELSVSSPNGVHGLELEYDVVESARPRLNRPDTQSRVVESSTYSTKQLYHIIKNMKKQLSVKLAFGAFTATDADGAKVENSSDKPCLIELTLGSETCYLRFIVYSWSP